MVGGLFITLYDEKTLDLYLNEGIYGFHMNPIYDAEPSSRSMHYQAIADYACSREGTKVFFFLNRKIYYAGTVVGNKDIASFFINGKLNPLGKKANSELFWDESNRYIKTQTEGVFIVAEKEKCQPYILIIKNDEDTGKFISSDELYFELGKYPYPLPSNTIQEMSFCTLTPAETILATHLIRNSKNMHNIKASEGLRGNYSQNLFKKEFLQYNNHINEAHIEFTLLADLSALKVNENWSDYILCRQVPISPFKPYNMDRADICLYSKTDPIRDGTIPNIVIELKKDKANYHAYKQAVRYLEWLQRISTEDEFAKIKVYIIAKGFHINKHKINLKFSKMIKLYDLNTNEMVKIN